MKKMFELGLIVNPYAGLGGARAMKGSDVLSEQSLKLTSTELRVTSRITHFLNALKHPKAIRIVTWAGSMGADYLASFKGEIKVIGRSQRTITTARDTIDAARAMTDYGVDLCLFVGGDGTARNVYDAIGCSHPALGLPSGVKMQSGCFALSPKATSAIIDSLILNGLVDLRNQEVRDLDEDEYKQHRVVSKYYGELLVPELGQFVQATKVGGMEVEELVVNDIADELDESLDSPIFIAGPGTTVAAFMAKRGLKNTLLGFDVVFNNEVILNDATSLQLDQYLMDQKDNVKLLLSSIGGQGHLLGRGNQQLSPKVLRRIGRDNLIVAATKTKLSGLNKRPLLLDTNDADLDFEWSGFIPVVTGYRDRVLYALSDGFVE